MRSTGRQPTRRGKSARPSELCGPSRSGSAAPRSHRRIVGACACLCQARGPRRLGTASPPDHRSSADRLDAVPQPLEVTGVSLVHALACAKHGALADSARQVRPTYRSSADRLEAVPQPFEGTQVDPAAGAEIECPHPVPLPEGEGTLEFSLVVRKSVARPFSLEEKVARRAG